MKKIMIVDDSSYFRKELANKFDDDEFEVIEAENGRVCIQLVMESSDIDAFIIDQNMPHLDGLSTIRKLRGLDHFKQTPIIILSTETNPQLKAQAKELGVAAWFIKATVSGERFVNFVKEFLSKS